MASKVQTVIFSKKESPSDVNEGNGWTVVSARAWLDDHDFRSDNVDEPETGETIRFRQFDPDQCIADSFQTLTENFPRGISAGACDVPERSGRKKHARASGVVDRRYLFGPDAELRVEEVDGEPEIMGHAAVFNQEALIWSRMREVVRPGAFTKTIGEADVRGLFNHDPNIILGRTQSGTLRLQENDRGLFYRIRAPKTALVNDLVLEPIRRGDMSGSSFSFETIKADFETNFDDGELSELRELLEVRLFDVGPATFPAYPATDAQVRAALETAQSADELAWIAWLRAGGLTDAQIRSMLHRASELLACDEPDQRSTPHPLLSRANRRIREAELEV